MHVLSNTTQKTASLVLHTEAIQCLENRSAKWKTDKQDFDNPTLLIREGGRKELRKENWRKFLKMKRESKKTKPMSRRMP